tara:strand:+ start:15337 stop:16374 length:1038 start_codon:yes stop_codon:yes gene_type:complete
MRKFSVLLVLLSTCLISAQKNLVKNGDFEIGLANWRGDAGTISPYEKKTGQKSCLISQYVGAEWKGIDQIISIPKNTYAIAFSAWIKTDAIEGGKESYNAGIATLEFMNAGETNISYENIAQLVGSNPWTLFKKQLIVPENAKKVRILLALAQTNGVILFDQINMIGISESTYLENSRKDVVQENKPFQISERIEPRFLLNGNFENGLNHWTGTGKSISNEKQEGSASALINATEQIWVHIDQTADVIKGVKKIKFSGWLKAKAIEQGAESWNNGLFIVEFTKDGINKTTEDQVLANIAGTTDWTLFEKTLVVPEGTKKYRIILALSNCIGTLMADNIQVTPILE